MLTRTATNGGFMQTTRSRVPRAAPGRAIVDPHIASRGVLHRQSNGGNGSRGRLACHSRVHVRHDGRAIDTPPPSLGAAQRGNYSAKK